MDVKTWILLEEIVIVAVLTCAAPMITLGREGMSEDEYQGMVYNRIMGMLKCAAYFGYKNLVLGEWECGAFGNDAHMISDLFYKALKEMVFNGMVEKDFFKRIDFAVLDQTDEQYNFKEFYCNFDYSNYYKDENQKEIDVALQRIEKTEVYLDKIRGSLFGGAVGDALGFPVEFTQMALFTANGILAADTRGSMRGIGGTPHDYIPMSYQDWLRTQEMTFEESRKQPCGYTEGCISWLADVRNYTAAGRRGIRACLHYVSTRIERFRKITARAVAASCVLLHLHSCLEAEALTERFIVPQAQSFWQNAVC